MDSQSLLVLAKVSQATQAEKALGKGVPQMLHVILLQPSVLVMGIEHTGQGFASFCTSNESQVQRLKTCMMGCYTFAAQVTADEGFNTHCCQAN